MMMMMIVIKAIDLACDFIGGKKNKNYYYHSRKLTKKGLVDTLNVYIDYTHTHLFIHKVFPVPVFTPSPPTKCKNDKYI